ncbi:MAG: molybdopterin molybdenumtransferase MoeA [Chitinophagaceae bacterium]|nr:MAG: molybdopterin molybdenumtransferase MoeA [Chitinophagaceae bacterium]
MISVKEAKDLIRSRLSSLESVRRPLLQAAGSVLAENIYASIDIPAFEQSSMDGYAIRFADKDQPLTVSGEMAAGAGYIKTLEPGTAIRIFTGAPVPDGADTIAIQEKVVREGDTIKINDVSLNQGFAVRAKGSEAKAGTLALAKDTYLGPAAVAYLAGIGVADVPVYCMPSVAILVTGNELQTPGVALEPGQVYESNSYSLTAALRETGISHIHVLRIEDKLDSLKYQLASVLEWADLVLLTGGVSVGDYDFVPEAARHNGVEEVFHKVKQRPGKPLFFGMKDRIPVFGLPGNPSSVLSCFYNYVLPAVEMLSRKRNPVKSLRAKMANDYKKPAGLTQFLKANTSEGHVRILGAQLSYQLSSFAEANCLAVLEEEREEYQAGEEIEVLMLPGF